MSQVKFTESHEWLRLESDGSVTVGITDFAQQQLGDIVFVTGTALMAQDVISRLRTAPLAGMGASVVGHADLSGLKLTYIKRPLQPRGIVTFAGQVGLHP